jgi:hypothetical protein
METQTDLPLFALQKTEEQRLLKPFQLHFRAPLAASFSLLLPLPAFPPALFEFPLRFDCSRQAVRMTSFLILLHVAGRGASRGSQPNNRGSAFDSSLLQALLLTGRVPLAPLLLPCPCSSVSPLRSSTVPCIESYARRCTHCSQGGGQGRRRCRCRCAGIPSARRRGCCRPSAAHPRRGGSQQPHCTACTQPSAGIHSGNCARLVTQQLPVPPFRLPPAVCQSVQVLTGGG